MNDLIQHAWMRQPSGKKLDVLNPDPLAWDDTDISIGLSRTYRWGGHSCWPLPLSVGQHSIMVMIVCAQMHSDFMHRMHIQRELLHDVEEALIGGFDPIKPIKPLFGDSFKNVMENLQKAAFTRYLIDAWKPGQYAMHKRADNIVAASEAIYVAGWGREEVKSLLQITLEPMPFDPLSEIYDSRPWEPWAPEVAASRFLDAFNGTGPAIDYIRGLSV